MAMVFSTVSGALRFETVCSKPYGFKGFPSVLRFDSDSIIKPYILGFNRIICPWVPLTLMPYAFPKIRSSVKLPSVVIPKRIQRLFVVGNATAVQQAGRESHNKQLETN